MAGFITLTTPDGKLAKFPDTMSKTQIRNVMASKYPKDASQDTPTPSDPDEFADLGAPPPPPEVLTQNEGLMSDAARFMGFDPHTDQAGDTVVKMAEKNEQLSSYIPDPMFSVGKAGRDLASGLLNLPGDVKEFITGENGMEVNIPEFRGGTAENIASGLLQFGLPAVGAANKVSQGIKAVAPNAGNLSRGLASLFAGAGADALVVDTQDKKLSGLGNLLPGSPTAIEPDDSGMTKRIKTGSENLFIGGATDTLGKLLGAVTSPFRRGRGTEIRTDSQGNQVEIENSGAMGQAEDRLANEMQEGIIVRPGETQDEAIQRVTTNIDESLERSKRDGYQPTTGTASNDPTLLMLEKTNSTSPAAIGRAQQNKDAIASRISQATDTTGMPSPETASDVARQNRDAQLGVEETNVANAEQDLATVQANRVAEGNTLATNVGKAPDASTTLDGQLVDLNQNMTNTKSDMFDAIDPQGRVQLPANNPMADAITDLRANTNPAIMADVDGYAKGVLDELSKPISFKEMNELRSGLSGAIERANRAGDGHVVTRLTEIKKQYDNVITQLSQTAGSIQAGNRAKNATDNFQDEFAPIQRDGVGGAVAQSIKNDPSRSTASKTAGKYLGSPEGAEQLAQTIAKVKDPKAAKQAVRDHMFDEIASSTIKADGTINVDRLSKLIEQRRAVLRDFPEVLSELEQLRNKAKSGVDLGANATDALRRAKDSLTSTKREQELSAAAMLLKSDDPVVAVNKALDSDAPKRKLSEMREAMEGDADGLAGLQSATRQSVVSRVGGVLETIGPNKDRVVSLAKLDKILKNKPAREAMLASGVSADDLAKLDGAYARIQEMARINEKVTGGSDTAANISKSAEGVKIFAASYFGIVAGRGVFRIIDMVQNILKSGAKQITAGSIDDIVLDPAFAKMLLLRDTNAVRTKMKTYLTANLPGLASREDGNDE